MAVVATHLVILAKSPHVGNSLQVLSRIPNAQQSLFWTSLLDLDGMIPSHARVVRAQVYSMSISGGCVE